MKIITISREFGSGGREIGKRLADELGFAYYDREIITEVAAKSQLDESYVEKMLESGMPMSFPVTFARTFSYPDLTNQNYTKILVEQHKFIKSLAEKGDDFIIVGRSADVILRDYNPLNIFVYADMESKIDRCMKRETSAAMTRREMEKKIKQIDKGRARNRELLDDSAWGEKEAYHLCINTSGKEIKRLVPAIAAFAIHWFE